MKAPRISREDLREKLDRGERLNILDIRNATDYAASDKKLPGAQRVPLEDIETVFDRLDKATEIITYCT